MCVKLSLDRDLGGAELSLATMAGGVYSRIKMEEWGHNEISNERTYIEDPTGHANSTASDELKTTSGLRRLML